MPKKPQLVSRLDLSLARHSGRTKVSCINGLEIRIHENGNMYYQYRHLGGKYKTTAIGSETFLSLEEAQKRAADMRTIERAAQSEIKSKNFTEAVHKKIKRQLEERDFLSPREIGKLLGNLFLFQNHNDRVNYVARLVLQFLIYVPIDPKMLLRAKWSDFDINQSELVIGRLENDLSSGKPAPIYRYPYELRQKVLEELKDTKNDYAFTNPENPKKPLSLLDLQTTLKAIIGNVRLDQFREAFFFHIRSLNIFDEKFIQEVVEGFSKRRHPPTPLEIYYATRMLESWDSLLKPHLSTRLMEII